MMHATEIQAHARKLYEAMGSKALVEAAQRAATLESGGNTDDAVTWRRIEAALQQMQGPRAK